MLPLLLLLAAGGGAVAAGGAAATRAFGARRPGRAATSAAAEAVRPGGGLARSGSAARLAGAWVLPVAVLAALAALRPAAAVVLQAEVEVLADGLGFAEGPVWLPAPRSALLFSDIAADQLLTWTRRAGVQVRRRGEPGGRIILTESISPQKIPACVQVVQTYGAGVGPNGNLLDAAGRLVTFRQGPAARDVVRQPPPDADRTAEVRGVGGDEKRIGEVALPAVEVLAARYEGRRLNGPNDGAVHPADGSIFFTDPNWGLVLANATASQELNVHGVYRLDTTTNATAAPLRLVLEGLAMPNGIGESNPSVKSTTATAERPCGARAHRVRTRRLTLSPPPPHRASRAADFSPAGDVLYVSDTGRPVGRDLLRSRPPVVAAFDVARMLAGGPGAAEPLWQTTQSSDGLCVTEEGVVILTSRLLFFQGVRQHAAAAAGRGGGLTD